VASVGPIHSVDRDAAIGTNCQQGADPIHVPEDTKRPAGHEGGRGTCEK
jgi:hypothetical protein